MLRKLLSLAALCVCTATVRAETNLLNGPTTFIDHKFIFGREARDVAQRALTSAHPALLGLSREHTAIRFSRALTGRAVTNANHGKSTARWRVAAIEIDGQEIAGVAGTTGQGCLPSVPSNCNGVDLYGTRPHVIDAYIHNFQGTCVRVPQGFVANCEIENGHTGIEVTSSDTQLVGPMYVHGQRDYCGHIKGGGNVTSLGVHWFGAGYGDEDTHTGNSAALYLDGTQYFRSTNDTYADAPNGLIVAGHNSEIANALFQHCTRRALLVTGGGNHFDGCKIFGQLKTNEWPHTTTVEFRWLRNVIEGGHIELSSFKHPAATGGAPSVGLLLSQNNSTQKADACKANCRMIDADGLNGTVGMKISAAVVGGEYTFDVEGFDESSDRLLVVDANALTDANTMGGIGMQGVKVRFNILPRASQTVDMTNPGTESAGIKKYVDIPAGWHSSNEIVIHNQLSKRTETLTPGTAY